LNNIKSLALMQPVYIVGASAVSAFGFDWRTLGSAVAAGASGLSLSRQLALSHGRVMAAQVPDVPALLEVPLKARKLMSDSARLCAVALGLVWFGLAWPPSVLAQTAMFVGVGASGAQMPELMALLGASIENHEFSLSRLGAAGLAACNPLFAFQLMNNFTLCHAAILNGVGGPNGAFFSRGTGTHAALAEAHWLVALGEATHALAGGADTALHSVTWASLRRDGWVAQGLVPGEGAAFLALSSQPYQALALLQRVDFFSAVAVGSNLVSFLKKNVNLKPQDLVVLAPWGQVSRSNLTEFVNTAVPGLAVVDVGLSLGYALAAAPALAWVAALGFLRQGRHLRAWVLSIGIDGGVGVVLLRSVS
jgi:hypothetical protein